MKKIGLFKKISAVLMSALLISGCAAPQGQSSSSGLSGGDQKSSQKKISVVCTIFPEYDWVNQIIEGQEDRYDVTLLLDNGSDLHSYQPTADDIAKISACDLFIYVGGESDGWVKGALSESNNPNMQVINLMEIMGNKAKEEEVKEGMQADDDHDHDHSDKDKHDNSQEADHDHADNKDSDHEHSDHEHSDHEHSDHEHSDVEEIEYDEHVWLSLKNSQALISEIEESIEKIDPENKEVYKNNTDKYTKKLASLDKEYETAVKLAKRNTVVFGDRFPFRYMVDDYNLDYYAAFVGCSAETEASFNTVVFLANKVDELDIPVVLTIEKSDQKIAKTIVENTRDKNQKIEVMDSLQSVTKDDIKAGTTYYGVMEKNLEVLKKALD